MESFNKETVTKYVNEALKIKSEEIIVLYADGNYKILNIQDFDSSDKSIIHSIKGSKLNLYFNVPKKQLKSIGTGYIKKYPVTYTKVVNTVFLRANQAMTLISA